MNLNDKAISYINLFFIFLFFPSLVTGVFLPNLIFGIFILSHLTLNFRNLANFINKYKIYTILFTAFYIYLLISSFFSNHIYFSLESSLLYFCYFIYTIAIIFIINKDNDTQKYILYFGYITFFIISLDAFYEIYTGYNIFNNSAMNGRISGMFGDRWVIGSYLVRLLPVLIGIFLINFYTLNKNIKYFIFFTSIMSIIVIVFSGERKAFLLLILYAFLIFFYLFNKIKIFNIFMYLCFCIVLFLLPFAFNDYKERITQQVVHHISNTNVNENQYLSMFKSSLEMFKDNLFFGVGPNNFRKECFLEKYNLSHYSCNTHPHNTPLQLLAETGIIGFIFVYGIFCYFIYKLFYLSRLNFNLKLFGIYSIICSIIMNLWPLIPSGNFFLSWYGIIYYLPIGLYLAYYPILNNKIKK